MSNTAQEPTHRYFDNADGNRDEKPSQLSPRTLTLASSVLAIACGLLALWLAKYTLVAWIAGLGLVLLGTIACIVSRRADARVQVLPSLGLVLVLLSCGLLVTNVLFDLVIDPS